MADKVYALAIHYRGKCKKLKNIDPDKYSYIGFVADITEVHAVGDETVLKITCTMDDSNATMNICNDLDGHEYENVEGDSNGEGDEWIDENGEDTGGRGSENESDDKNISGEDSENESVGEDSGDELSDYKSDDHCEPNNFSDSEFEDDPLHGSLNRMHVLCLVKTGQKIKLEKGMVFVDINAFRKVLKEFVIQEGFKVMRMRNEKKKRVTAHCSVKDFPWRVHASPLVDGVTFQVKTYVPNHTCVRSDPTKEASAEWIASKIESVLRENPGMKVRGIRNELKKFGVNPQYMQIYRAKKKAMESIEGSYAESFGRMSYYADLVLEKNEGSVVTLQCDVDETEPIHSTHIFKRFFLGLSALRDGFLEGCSPFLGFDGCYLKGPFGGVLLAAIGLDGNNGLFPVAFAIVESECKESWTFFFENLSMLVRGFSVDKLWTFMSDRQKGLVETINEVVPHAINRRCARHIYANFGSQFVGTALKRYFWQAARSYSAAGFNFALYKIKELKPAAYEWLLKILAEMWSRHAFDPRRKNDHVTNNISESFNHWVGELRSKPILTLVDGLRAKLMSRLQKRKQKGIKWSDLVVPNVVKGLNLVKEETRKCHLLVAGIMSLKCRMRILTTL
ncbi:hypothetical protein Sango_0829700 [Sesamum angolense]|uniref:Transposase n=1 Tax=Sesamum angolense TaxID=2727404 RepID=A0AAE1X3U6_9LAMI|nr:hypothetical protein Sango_0829700 [Sesamum angolense]